MLEALLASSLIPAFPERLTELAASAVARARGARIPLWDRLGESPAVDLVIEESAVESERLRLRDLHAALVRHELIEKSDNVLTPEKLAYLFGLNWDSALKLIGSSDLGLLASVLEGENRSLPRTPDSKPLKFLGLPAWDRFLAQIMVALDPRGYPRFMGAPVASSDLVEFSKVSDVVGDFTDFPDASALRVRGKEFLATPHSSRIDRLYFSRALSVFAALAGHARLGILDEEWHQSSAELDVRLIPVDRIPADSLWRGMLLCCLADLGWATRLGAEAAVRTADVRARKSRWFRAWRAGASIPVDLAIVVYHDEAAVAGDYRHAVKRGALRGLFLVIPAFLLVCVVLSLGTRFDPSLTTTIAGVVSIVPVIVGVAVVAVVEAASVRRRRRPRRRAAQGWHPPGA